MRADRCLRRERATGSSAAPKGSSRLTRRRAAQGGGTQAQAIGRLRGGLTTRIVALVDALGDLSDPVLLPGQARDLKRDLKGVAPLIEDVACDALLADKAFDADVPLAELDLPSSTAKLISD